MNIVRIAGTSKCTAAAGAIAGVVTDHGRAHVQAVGAGAVNQAVKADAVAGGWTIGGDDVRASGVAAVGQGMTTAAIARRYLSLDGIHVICLPDFVELVIQGQERTGLRITIEPR